MSKPSVLIVGSGAGGSVAAWALAREGHPVVVLEKGRNLFPQLGCPDGPGTLFSNDEVKRGRYFEAQDPILEPRAYRTQDEARRRRARSFVGDVNDLPTTVGGGTVHWDAKTPRFWRQDFHGRSLHGPIPDANLADWPLSYEDLEPFYDEVEEHLGVQGDLARMPASTLAQAPRGGPFPMAPNPPMYAGTLLAEGADRLGYAAYPFPMAVHSEPRNGGAACNSCGFCGGFGCAIGARGSAVTFLHEAVLTGAEIRSRCFAHRVDMARDGRRALGVSYIDAGGAARSERADVVVLAASAIETARLLLLSTGAGHEHGLGNRSGQVGRNLMFHYLTTVAGLFEERVHAWRGPATTFTLDDLVGPVAGRVARAADLPYLKGGIVELGGGVLLLEEARAYARAGLRGRALKDALRELALRDHLASLTLIGEDLPQALNRVDLDPRVRDVYGFPVPRITHSPHRFETAASRHFGAKLAEIVGAAPGAAPATPPPHDNAPRPGTDLQGQGPFSSAHVLGTARMGDDPDQSVCDRFGRLHEIDNVYAADGSVFVSSGGANPTLTLMALALRMARQLSGADAEAVARRGQRSAPSGRVERR